MTLSAYARVRRRDQRDTETYIAAFDRSHIALLDAAYALRHREARERHLPEINRLVRDFVSPRERLAFARIPRPEREAAYLRICSSSASSALSERERLIHKRYVHLQSLAFACEVSRRLTEAFELTGRGACRAYDPRANGKYPVRDLADRPLLIAEIADKSFWSASGARYPSTDVFAYIDRTLDERKRERMYDGLTCRPIERRDVLHRGEAALIGTDGVFFARAHDSECIGVYAGKRGAANSVRNAAYRVTVFDPEREEHIEDIDGDGILAKMNTSFAYDWFGLPYAQRSDGYTADLALFGVTFDDGRESVLHAFFGTGRAGAEARWNYWYTPQAIRRYFRPRPRLRIGAWREAVTVDAPRDGSSDREKRLAAELAFLGEVIV